MVKNAGGGDLYLLVNYDQLESSQAIGWRFYLGCIIK